MDFRLGPAGTLGSCISLLGDETDMLFVLRQSQPWNFSQLAKGRKLAGRNRSKTAESERGSAETETNWWGGPLLT